MNLLKKQMLGLLVITVFQLNITTLQAQVGPSVLIGEWEFVSGETKEYKSEKPTALLRQQAIDVDNIQQDVARWSQIPLTLVFNGADMEGGLLVEYPNAHLVSRTYQQENDMLMIFLDKREQPYCPDCPEGLLQVGEFQYQLNDNTLTLQFEYTANNGSGSVLYKAACRYRKK